VEKIKLVNVDTEEVIAEDVKEAYTFWSRLKGLMFTKNLPERSGLHIFPCTAIHTFFMNYGIDILYLNKENIIVGMETALEPGKVGKKFKHAKSVIELPAGTLENTSTLIGQAVSFEDSITKK
jgi:hypothetical protein